MDAFAAFMASMCIACDVGRFSSIPMQCGLLLRVITVGIPLAAACTSCVVPSCRSMLS